MEQKPGQGDFLRIHVNMYGIFQGLNDQYLILIPMEIHEVNLQILFTDTNQHRFCEEIQISGSWIIQTIVSLSI